ncbi:MAG: SH3 domain-containing protein [Solobacterium sp.]|nr:SH3 domain-containing protein [Solobacterium sp.]
MTETKNIASLLAGARENDRDAIQQLLKEYATKMYFVSRLYLKDREAAKDTEQEALREVFSNLDDVDENNFEDRMREAIRAHALNRLQLDLNDPGEILMRKRHSDTELKEDADSARKNVLKALDRLSDTSRVMTVLSSYEKMDSEAIAQQLNIAPAAAANLVSAADREMSEKKISSSMLRHAMEFLSPAAARPEPLQFLTPDAPAEPEVIPEETPEPEIVPEEIPAEPEEVPAEPEVIPEEIPAEPEAVSEEILPEPEPAEETDPMENTAELPAFAPAEETPAPVREEISISAPAAKKAPEELPEPEEDEEMEKKGLPVLTKILMFLAAAACLVLLIFDSKLLGILPSGKKNNTPSQQSGEPSAEVTPSADPAEVTPTPVPHPEGSVGSARVQITGLRIRKGPGTNYEIIGEASNGEIFDVYEIKNDGTFDWYRVGENKWIANNGQYAVYTPYE